MHPNEYQELALSKEADQEVIRQRIYAAGVQATRLENAARGLSDEAGELSGAVKSYLEYGKPLDRINVIEECGDALWRISQALRAVGATLEEAMESNLRKLHLVRYRGTICNPTYAAEENRDRAAERKAIGGVHNAVTLPKDPWIGPHPHDVKEREAIQNGGMAVPLREDENGIPRLNRIDPNYPAERAIREAINAVEAVGAHGRLTEAVILLSRAHEMVVADYIDASAKPREQTGAGFAEPPEVVETLPPTSKFSWQHDSIESYRQEMRSHGRHVSTSYNRMCSACRRVPIHKANTSDICADCYASQPKPQPTA